MHVLKDGFVDVADSMIPLRMPNLNSPLHLNYFQQFSNTVRRAKITFTTDHCTTKFFIRSRRACWQCSQVRCSASGRNADSIVLVDRSKGQ